MRDLLQLKYRYFRPAILIPAEHDPAYADFLGKYFLLEIPEISPLPDPGAQQKGSLLIHKYKLIHE